MNKLYLILILPLLISSAYATKGVIYAKLELGKETRPLMIKPYVLNRINILGRDWVLQITDAREDEITVKLESDNYSLKLNEPEIVDLNGNGYYDLALTLDELRGRMSFIIFEHIHVPHGMDTIVEEIAENETEIIIGNDTDEHGCVLMAGYTWCEARRKCLRGWEEECEESTDESISLKYPLTILIVMIVILIGLFLYYALMMEAKR